MRPILRTLFANMFPSSYPMFPNSTYPNLIQRDEGSIHLSLEHRAAVCGNSISAGLDCLRGGVIPRLKRLGPGLQSPVEGQKNYVQRDELLKLRPTDAADIGIQEEDLMTDRA